MASSKTNLENVLSTERTLRHNMAAEIERLKKEEKKLTGEIKRCEGMLGNPNFVNKAPEKKIAEEREKLEKYKGMMEQVKERLAHFTKP